MKNTRVKTLFSTRRRHVLAGVIATLCFWVTADAQTTLFRFETKLPNSVTPATGFFQMQFKLFDAATGGTQIGASNAVSAVDVQNRSLSVWLDFGGAAFPGADRYVEIDYRRFNHEPFTTLAMRERVLSVPYAIRSLTSGTADNALNLNGVPAADFVQTDDPRLSDDRNPLPGSEHYIQNMATQQSPANFNISGTGRANILHASTQFNLGGIRPGSNRILSSGGGGNLFVGFETGANNSSGDGNTFVGDAAGEGNSTGRANTFVGRGSGTDNTTGRNNTFLGAGAGSDTTFGGDNTFVGAVSGARNGGGRGNTFIGGSTGFTGPTITGANQNNTLIGYNTEISPGVSNSTAIGANLTVTRSNSIVIGTSAQAAHLAGGVASTFGTSSSPSGLIASNLVFARLGLDFAASDAPVCFRIVSVANQAGESFGGNGLTSCLSSSASIAEKTHVRPFTSGMDVIRQLKPVNFKWKGDGKDDIGLNAEDVAEVAPTMVRRNAKGEANDVTGGGLNALFINAFNEQQTQIEAQEKTIQTQREQIKELHRQIEAIRQLICKVNALVDACK
jgi:hypothetical protein